MKSAIFFTIVVFLSTFSQGATIPSATELMNAGLTAYRSRFDANNSYIDDPFARRAFIQKQTQLIEQIKLAGYAKRFVRVYNNFAPTMIITVSLVQEPTGAFAGLIVERSQYESEKDAEGLRLYNLGVLAGGMVAFSFNGTPLITLKSLQLSAISGGVISVKYPTNYKSNTFDDVSFQVIKTTEGDFSFFDMNKSWFGKMNMNIWHTMIPFNFGISEVTFSK